MAKALGFTRILIPGFTELKDRAAVIRIGGKNLAEIIDDLINKIDNASKSIDNASKGSSQLKPIENIEALTAEQLEALRCGDVVVKEDETGQHAYLVSYKSRSGICLTYSDCENVETIAYEKVEGTWTYDSKDVTHIAS